MSISKRTLFISCALMSLCSAPAYAQDLGTIPPAEPATTTSSDQASASSRQPDIVVTARRREESLQDVPVAVTAFGAEDLREKNLTNAIDLQRATPSLQIRSNGAQRSDVGFFIRGQGATFGSQPGVITYFNEVPEYRTLLGSNVQFYDLQSIQVLKGPQGTLFGRSTTGGAVLITPQRPTNAFEGFVEAKIGNFDMRELTGAINVPVVDGVLALRFAGNLLRRDGFTRNLVNGEDLDNKRRESYRISMLFSPGPEFEMLTMFRGERFDENATGTVLIDYDEGHSRYQPAVYGAIIGQICGAFNPGNPTGLQACVSDRTQRMQSLVAALAQQEARVRNGDDIDEDAIRANASAINSFLKGEVQQLSNIITISPGYLGPILGEIQIKDIFATNRVVHAASYRSVAGAPLLQADTCNGCDIVGGQIVTPDYASKRDFFDNFSNELQIGGSSDLLDWVLGWYYNRDERPIMYPPLFATYNTAFNTTTPLGIGSVQGQFTLDEKAIDRGYYGQATIRPFEGLSLTAGYRYSKFTRTAEVSVPRITAAGLVPTTMTESPPVDDSASSYTFAADYQVTPDLLVYVTHRRGFKPGGANLAPTTPVPGYIANFGPEIVTDFEGGVKYSWSSPGFAGRANLAVFTTDYSDIQRNEVLPVPGTASVLTQVNNIAAARIDGLELETVFEIGERLTIGANYAYLNARYTEYPGTVTGIDGVVRNRIDQPFVGTPDHSGSANVRYSLFDNDMGELSISGNIYAQSAAQVNDGSLESPIDFGRQEPYAQIGGRIDWSNIMGRPIDAALFVTNLTNEVHVEGIGSLASALGVLGGIYSEPRFYGASLRFRF